MAVNPSLDQHGLPVPFVGEVMVLMREGVEFHVDNIPSLGGRKWVGKGVLFLSSVRMVFVARRSTGESPVRAFDMPLLFVFHEKFNQPIFGCNNISARVLPVQGPGDAPSPSVQLPHSFVIYFMEGGVGTFLPIFTNLLHSLRAANPHVLARAQSSVSAAPSPGASATSPSTSTSSSTLNGDESPESLAQSSVDPVPALPPVTLIDNIRSAYVDPNDPTVVYVEQPSSFGTQVRRRQGYTAAET